MISIQHLPQNFQRIAELPLRRNWSLILSDQIKVSTMPFHIVIPIPKDGEHDVISGGET